MGHANVEDDVTSELKEWIYMLCTFKLRIPLWTYDAMLAQPQFNPLKKMKRSCTTK